MNSPLRCARVFQLIVVSVLFAFLTALPVASGVLTGTILGSVLVQATGQPIGGAAVSIRNVDTGFLRTLQTDADGNYRFDLVPLGLYEVRAEAPNYQTLARGDIESSITTIPIVQFSMAPAAAPGKVEQGGGEVIVNLVNATLGAGLSGDIVSRLPLGPISRNYDLLALTLPGVNQPAGTTGGDFTANGQRTRANSFTIDGSDNNDITLGIRRGRLNTLEFPQAVETVQELQFLVANPNAEYGRNPGGNVNLVSRSGGNNIHGTLYYAYGGDSLNARNFFDGINGNGAKQGLTLNRYSAEAGGPIVKDRTFWFASLHGQWVHTRFGETLSVPSDSLRTLLTTAFPGAVMQEVLGLYPHANQGTSGFVRSTGIATDDTGFSIKVDHSFNPRHRFSARYNFIDSDETNPTGGFSTVNQFRVRNQDIALSLNSFLTDHLSNQARFSFGRTALTTDVTSAPGNPQLLGGAARVQLGVGFLLLGQIFTQTFAPVGDIDAQPHLLRANTFQFADSMIYIHGRHSLKWGFDIRRNQINAFNRDFSGHHFRPVFDPFAGFLILPGTTIPGDLSSFTQSFGSDAAGLRNAELDFFLQDDIRVRPGLMLNFGLRYEVNTAFHEINNRFAQPYRADKSNLGPRIGFAWDPTGKGKWSLRGGYGILFDTTFGNLVLFLAELPPLAMGPVTTDVTALARNQFANPFLNFDPVRGPLPPFTFADIGIAFLPDPRLHSSYSQDYNLTIEHELMQDTIISWSYVGTRGTKLTRDVLVEKQIAPLPFLAPVTHSLPQLSSISNSTYNAMQLTFLRRFRRGLFVRAAWTYSSSIDDASDNFFAGAPFPVQPNDPANLHGERGFSNFDARHRFVFSYVWEIPGFKNQAGFLGKIFGGWQLSGITQFATGTPFSLRELEGIRPNNVPGAILPGTQPTQLLRLASGVSTEPGAGLVTLNGAPGNLGRNTERLQGINNFDVAIGKRFRLHEGYDLEFRTELFNIFNRTQMGVPDPFVDDSDFGRVFNTLSTPRNVQFSLRLHF